MESCIQWHVQAAKDLIVQTQRKLLMIQKKNVSVTMCIQKLNVFLCIFVYEPRCNKREKIKV